MADYNRSVEDNFRFLGDVGSLASTAQNSDLVHVETSDYNFAVHDQLAHTSNKYTVVLVCAVLAVLHGLISPGQVIYSSIHASEEFFQLSFHALDFMFVIRSPPSLWF